MTGSANLPDIATGWRVLRQKGPGQLRFWTVALGLGIAAGLAAVGFRVAVSNLQTLLYGADERAIARFAMTLHWSLILALPVAGGLAVGLILHWLTPDGRAASVADTIEGAALNRGRVGVRTGLASTLAALITLSSGGSSGREGPVVHLAAVISTWVADRMKADGVTGRDLMGCAVAAAVSASFNAPIAGALFALEVILRHFAINAFAPIVIASVAGAVVSRLTLGDVTEFSLPHMPTLAFYVELPAFLMLGLLSGLMAAILMWSCFWTERMGDRFIAATRLPRWLRPGLAGLILGGLAIWFPHIIGVGYETTFAALTGQYLFHEAVALAVVKTAAVAITLGGRMGGGIFSPSLMLGALLGLAFGIVATAALPEVSGAGTLYALAGMGAVAAAVLGAPISTTLIVFEMTGDWQAGLAVMVAVSISTALASRLVHRSYFLSLLKARGVHLAEGPQGYLLSLYRVGMVMRPLDDPRVDRAKLQALADEGHGLRAEATLEPARRLLESEDMAVLPGLKEGAKGDEICGALFQVDVLKIFNRALAAAAAEEHR